MLNQDVLKKPWYRWYALFILLMVYTSSHVDRQIMGILLEPIKMELNASDTQMGFLVGLTFAIFYATLGIPIAMLADRSNRRNIIAISVIIWSGMTALCGLAGSYVQLALARIGVGIGEAGCTPPANSLIADYYAPRDRSQALGVYSMGVTLGSMFANLIGGWVTDTFDWRTAFFVVGLPGLLIALIFKLTVKEPPRGFTDPKGTQASEPVPLREAIRELMTKPAFRPSQRINCADGTVPAAVPTSIMVMGSVANWRSSPSMLAPVKAAARKVSDRPLLNNAWQIARTKTFLLSRVEAIEYREYLTESPLASLHIS